MWVTYMVAVQAFYAQLAAHGVRGAVITFTWKATPINARRRKELAELVASPSAKHVIAHALVTNSRPVQMVLEAIHWFVKKSYAEQVFIEPGAALDWLQKFVQLDRAAIVNDLSRAVPSAERDPSWSSLSGSGATPRSRR